MKTPLFYKDKPIFGVDVGFNSVKVMQIDTSQKQHRVVGYGYTNFDSRAVKNGTIAKPDVLAKAIHELFTKNLIGTIDTRRVAAAIPISRTFNRVLALPAMDKKDIDEAVRLEAEQYIPMSLDELYIDYEIDRADKDGMEILVVAVPRTIIDSYLQLFELLALEVALFETSITSATRLVMHAQRSDEPTLIIDFGSVSTDLSIFDTTLRVTGTIESGGDTITKAIAKQLGVTTRQAHTIKTRHGLNAGKKREQIVKALTPMLDTMVSEIKKMVRFYQERSDKKRKLEQVIVLGGGANMPGLAGYLTDKIRIPTRMASPWENLGFGKLQPPHELEKTLYATCAGLTLADPREID